MKEVASGITGAAPIWRKVILAALKEKLDEPINPPSDVIQIDVDKISGYVAHDGFDAKKEYFVKGTESLGEDPIHKKIRDCNGDLKEIYVFKERDPFEKDGKNLWQTGIDEWLKGQSDAKYHPETIQSCGNQVWITMQSPVDKARVDSNDVEVRFDVSSPNPIKKAEVSVDGVLKQTLVSEPWKVVVNMPNAPYHKIDVVVIDEQNNVGSRFLEIGVNQDFSKP